MKKPQAIFSPQGEKAVLLLHAYSGSPNDVRMLARALEKKNYTVYVPVYRGHGTSEPLDILQEEPETWWQESKAAVRFLQEKGYREISVFGLSMGGIFAMRLLTELGDTLSSGGFFCSPITAVETTVVENFLLYTQRMLEQTGASDIESKLVAYKPLVIEQLAKIEAQAQRAHDQLDRIAVPVFLAQAGADEMIDPTGVFQTVQKLEKTDFTLKWYPTSGHVLTVSPERRQLERDVADFLAALD